MRGDHVPHAADGDVAEVLGGAEQQVGAPALVILLAVPLVAGPARQEEPPLQRVAPAGRFVNEVAWGRTTDPQVTGLPRGPSPAPPMTRCGQDGPHSGVCPRRLLPRTGFMPRTLRGGGLSRPLGLRPPSILLRPPSVLQASPPVLV